MLHPRDEENDYSNGLNNFIIEKNIRYCSAVFVKTFHKDETHAALSDTLILLIQV